MNSLYRPSPTWIYWVGLVVLALTAGYSAPQLVHSLFSAGGFMPHGVCYTWMPPLLWLHLASDVMIGLAYFSIPVALVYFVRKRRDLPFNWIFVLFGVFIVACGATHWLEVMTLWYPYYWLTGAVKALTAAASVPTAIATVLLIPQALGIPSVAQLRAAKAALEEEVAQRRKVEEALRRATVELEARVLDRTAALSAANAELQRNREWFEVTVASIGDAVIATDVDGRVLLVNVVAEQLTGWTAVEARGRPLDDVFVIEDESDGAAAPNPATRAIEEGRIVGLANHTVLVSRGGTRRPIDDSAAPIRDGEGTVRGAVLIFRDVSERRAGELQRERLTEALTRSNALLDALFEQAPLGLGVWDRDCRYVRLNPALAAINGVAVEDHLGRRIDEVLPDMDPNVLKAFQSVVSTGAPLVRQEVSGITPAQPGRLRHWNVSYFPVRSGASLDAVGAICEEITDRKAAEAERAELLAAAEHSRADAERANRSKDEFLATVSHELRTPLQAIIGWVQLLESGRLGAADARRAIERVGNNVRAQARLIDDLLDLSRIVTGKLNLAIGPVHAPAIVESALETLRPDVGAKGLELVSRIDADVPVIQGDPDRLRQVVWNLLSNAVKFTPAGGRIEVALAATPTTLTLTVTDTGQGIDADLLPVIFERFRQGREGTHPQSGGLGLGLAIVQHIVALHGGRVTAESDGPGRGAQFVVTLPRVTPLPETLSRHDFAVEPPNLRGVRILVVDDMVDTREGLAGGLATYGADVAVAGDAAEAIASALRARPELIVTDIGMPGTDGIGLLGLLRSHGLRMPVIALTAYGSSADRTRSAQAGFAEHLTKPVAPVELARAIRRVLARVA